MFGLFLMLWLLVLLRVRDAMWLSGSRSEENVNERTRFPFSTKKMHATPILYYTILYYTKLVMLLDEATAEAVSIVCGGVRAISRSSPPRTPLINRRCNKFIFI